MYDDLIRAEHALIDGHLTPAVIGIRAGRVMLAGPPSVVAEGRVETVLGDDEVLLPGLVDSHVHVCEPGHTDWEGFASATRAAAAGGITTVVDMPVDSVPATVDVSSLEEKRRAAGGSCFVDVGFWGGVVPDNLGQLVALHSAGVLGFKCFLSESGAVDFPPVDKAQMVAALGVLRELDAPLLVHAETDGPTAAEIASPTDATVPGAARRRYADYLISRPPALENHAVSEVIEAVRATAGRAHVVHVSSAGAVSLLAQAREEGLHLTAETCPHYLILSAEEIDDGATEAKCSPPVREASNRDGLWAGLRRGVLDMVVSDHSPCTSAMKAVGDGDFRAAWGGISSLQLGLPLMWTAARERGIGLAEVVSWMAEGPAKLAGLHDRGRIAPGYLADLCVLAPDESFVVDPRRLEHRHPVTPYGGRRLFGVVRRTMLHGRWLDESEPARGTLLRR